MMTFMNSKLGEEIKSWVVSIVVAVLLALVIRYFIVELYMVEGSSMKPTLINAERLVVNKFIYRFTEPKRGAVVVFKYPSDTSRDFIKRVIAVGGDTVEVRDGRVFVNGSELNEPYILEKTRGYYPLSKVPQGHIFVMGDNRNNSEDSRFADVGFVNLDLLKGKAVLVFWPFNKMRTLP